MKMRSSREIARRYSTPRARQSRQGRGWIRLALVVCLVAAACGSSSSSSSTSTGGATSGLVTTSGPASGEIQHLNWALPVGEPDTIICATRLITARRSLPTTSATRSFARRRRERSSERGVVEAAQLDNPRLQHPARHQVLGWQAAHVG